VKEFEFKSRIWSWEGKEKEEEPTEPVMKFESKVRRVNCFKEEIVEGKVPWREFFERFNALISMKFPMMSGSCPVRLQELNSIEWIWRLSVEQLRPDQWSKQGSEMSSKSQFMEQCEIHCIPFNSW
jgi:hypothetical protein